MIDNHKILEYRKRLSIFLRFVDQGEPSSSYLGSIQLDDGKANTITNVLHDTLSQMGLEEQKMVSLGTDGAATMVGRKSGVGTQIKSKYASRVIVSTIDCHLHASVLRREYSYLKRSSPDTTRYSTISMLQV